MSGQLPIEDCEHFSLLVDRHLGEPAPETLRDQLERGYCGSRLARAAVLRLELRDLLLEEVFLRPPSRLISQPRSTATPSPHRARKLDGSSSPALTRDQFVPIRSMRSKRPKQRSAWTALPSRTAHPSQRNDPSLSYPWGNGANGVAAAPRAVSAG